MTMSVVHSTYRGDKIIPECKLRLTPSTSCVTGPAPSNRDKQLYMKTCSYTCGKR